MFGHILDILLLCRELMDTFGDTETAEKIDVAFAALNAERHRSENQAVLVRHLKEEVERLRQENDKLKNMVKK